MTNTQLWFRGVRASKFRHVFGLPAKREGCYENIKITRNAHDSHFCAVNPKFLAVVTEVAGGGTFVVLPVSKTGRLDFNASRVSGHRGPVLDIKWNPFNDNIIASCSDDSTVKLWYIPDGGPDCHLDEWLMELRGHKRRVSYIEWHPTAENVLVSAGLDHLLIVWDVGLGTAVSVIDCHPDVIYCMSWNRDGSLLATTCKDRKLRVIEPRRGLVVAEGVCHAGTRTSKVTFLGATGRLLTTGFSRHSDRQYAVWNQNCLDAPLTVDTIDSSSGVLFPYYDSDTGIVFLAGKGDGNIRYYEVVDQSPWLHYLNQFLSGNPQRGLGFMPKRGLDTSVCEIFRFYKLHATRGLCEPLSMIVPRKSEQFQEDLYPDTAAALPALTAHDWVAGRTAKPVLMSLRTSGELVTPLKISPSGDSTITAARSNNNRKFAFLSHETVPDYRPVDVMPLSEKSHKTNSNQTTKFQQIQRMFCNKSNILPADENKMSTQTFADERNELLSESPKTEFQLKRAYLQQRDELKLLRKQLVTCECRIQELEQQLAALRH